MWSKDIDNDLFRLKNILQSSWEEIRLDINLKYYKNFTVQSVKNRFIQLNKQLNLEQIQELFEQFKKNDFSYKKAADRISCLDFQAKKQIISVLVNNIYRMCVIVRKRKISFLTSNFIPIQKIRSLVQTMLTPKYINQIHNQYSIFWNFVSRPYPDSFFGTVKNEQYKEIYRQLIILAEKFKLNSNDTEKGFEASIIQQSIQKPNSLMNRINSYKKKSIKQTIDLISSEQEQGESKFSDFEYQPSLHSQKESQECQIQTKKVSQQQFKPAQKQKQRKRLNILKKLVDIKKKIKEFEQLLKNDSKNTDFKRQMARLALTETILLQMIG